ncbi:alpha/beta-hydrolase [Amylostereum chailletii]|nr:alpha/beta-hydrolase [Amylostereum chailletii]
MNPITVTYKHVDGLDILMDIYPPLQTEPTRGTRRPAVVYFHGGGMTVGDRNSWFPDWLCTRAVDSGIAFITVDHRLLAPSTGHDVLADIRDLFAFLADALNPLLAAREEHAQTQIDPSRLAVAGTSAGGLCCYLAAVHATPKPKALVSFYGLGGDFLSPHFYTPKHEPFFRGRALLDPASFRAYLHPQSAALPVLSGSPLTYPTDRPGEVPSNPRMPLARLYLQLGVYLDYWTGVHGLGARLARLLPAHVERVSDATRGATRAALPEDAKELFPQLWVTKHWPRTLLVHGEMDTAVHAADSRRLHQLLRTEGVDARLEIVQGEEHSFDYQPGAEAKFGALFDRVRDFLREALVGVDG